MILIKTLEDHVRYEWGKLHLTLLDAALQIEALKQENDDLRRELEAVKADHAD